MEESEPTAFIVDIDEQGISNELNIEQSWVKLKQMTGQPPSLFDVTRSEARTLWY